MTGTETTGDSGDPRVGVVTVSYRSRSVLGAFLASVPAASSREVTTVVVDNDATGDDVADLAAAHKAVYIPLEHNVGYGGAVNAAVTTLPSSVEWVLVCNPDLVLAPGSIDTLVATGDSDARIAAVGPAIRETTGELYPSARRVPSLRTGIGHALFSNLWIGNPWTRAYRNDTKLPNRARDAGWLSGACVLVRRSSFDALGGFDERYFMYFEDVDLGYRIGLAGWVNRYEPSAIAIHAGGHSTGDSARMIDEHHRSARRFIRRKYRGWWLWPVRAGLGAGLSIRSAVIRRRMHAD